MRNSNPLLIAMLMPVLAVAAHAKTDCPHSSPRNLALDLKGAKTVVFKVGRHDLKINAREGASSTVSGKACASRERDLPNLKIEQRRSGDQLEVSLDDDSSWGSFNLYGVRLLVLEASIPDDLRVEVEVGSGDALVDGAAELHGEVGSGDLRARNIQGTFFAEVGSGDIAAEGVGALHVAGVGSGDLVARGVRGETIIGSIGSGDLKVVDTQGRLQIEDIGSGGVQVADIGGALSVEDISSGELKVSRTAGSVKIRSLGSGDIEVADVRGDLSVERIGSGALDARRVDGDLTVESLGSGDVSHHEVRGRVSVPQDE